MRIIQSDQNITPFWGFNFCCELFHKKGISSLIDKHLGKRVKLFGFDYRAEEAFVPDQKLFMSIQ